MSKLGGIRNRTNSTAAAPIAMRHLMLSCWTRSNRDLAIGYRDLILCTALRRASSNLEGIGTDATFHVSDPAPCLVWFSSFVLDRNDVLAFIPFKEANFSGMG